MMVRVPSVPATIRPFSLWATVALGLALVASLLACWHDAAISSPPHYGPCAMAFWFHYGGYEVTLGGWGATIAPLLWVETMRLVVWRLSVVGLLALLRARWRTQGTFLAVLALSGGIVIHAVMSWRAGNFTCIAPPMPFN